MFKTVDEAFNWLLSQKNSKKRKGLKKIEMALSYLNIMKTPTSVIHVTGTNGKGSTISFLKNLFLSQNLNVVTFTSPHITNVRERFTYNDSFISEKEFIDICQIMVKVNDYMESTKFGRLVYFELLTVMLAIYMKDKQADITIIEVGIGGLNDCTNVYQGQQSIITTIDLDHPDYFGGSIEKTAREKSGIIKINSEVILGRIPDLAIGIIEKRAKQQHAHIYKLGMDFTSQNMASKSFEYQAFSFSNQWLDCQEFKIEMLGNHQIDNASVALQSFHLWMNRINKKINWNQAIISLKKVHWIARMECISKQPLIYIDGAHNESGLNALIELCNQYFKHKTIHILYSGLNTKNQYQHIKRLNSNLFKSITITEFDHYQALKLNDVKKMIYFNSDWELTRNWKAWMYNYLNNKEIKEDILIVTGSLYFVSQVRDFCFNLPK